MGTRTLEEFWEEIRDATQRPTLDTAKITRWVNQSMKEFGYAVPMKELEAEGTLTTAAGTSAYAISGFTTRFRAFHEAGGRIILPVESIGKIKKETLEQRDRRLGDSTDESTWGKPEWYVRYGTNYYLRPVPDDVYTINQRYWQSITEISMDSDVTPFSDDWDDITMLGALYRAYRSTGSQDRMINARNDFIGQIRSRLSDDEMEEFAVGGLNIITDESSLTMDSDG